MTEIEVTESADQADQSVNGVVSFDLSRMEIKDVTAKFDLPRLSVHMTEPTLVVFTATNENSKYSAASLRMSGKRQRKIASNSSVSSVEAKRDRDEDRILYPRYVVVGWSGVYDKDGKPAKFDHDNCKAFIAALPNWLFDRLRIFCMKPEDFLSEDDFEEMAEPNAAEVAGN